MRIKGYSDLLKSENKTDAETIFLQASACKILRRRMHVRKTAYVDHYETFVRLISDAML
jgi:hypothetical protein